MEALGYEYVGPAELLTGLTAPGHAVDTADDMDRLNSIGLVAGDPLTFVVSMAGLLLLAPRESEHVACASGERVLTAGEVTFVKDGEVWRAVEVSNQSTGYCPEPTSFPAFAAATTRAGVDCPHQFTDEFIFRLCTTCGERNLVRDQWFVCAICDSELDSDWNFPRPSGAPLG